MPESSAEDAVAIAGAVPGSRDVVAVTESPADDRPAASSRCAPDASAPLSHVQERIFLSHQFVPDLDDNTVLSMWLMRGPLDIGPLTMALEDVVARHSILRTVYGWDEGSAPVQRVLAETKVPVELVQTHSDDPTSFEDATAIARTACSDWWGQPFDLEARPPVRTRLLTLAPDTHVLCLAVHHIAIDGWATSLVLNDLSDAYRARLIERAPQWKPIPAYQEYVWWERSQLAKWTARDVPFWRDQLRYGVPELLFPVVDASEQTDAITHASVLPSQVMDSVIARGQAVGALPLGIVVHALAEVLSEMFGQQRMCLGTVVSGRFDNRFDSVVGCFVNEVPIFVDLSAPDDGLSQLRATARSVMNTLRHARTPIDEVFRSLSRSHRQPPLYQVLVVLHHATQLGDFGPGLTASTMYARPPRTKSDLLIELKPHTEGNWLVRSRWRREPLGEVTGREIVTGIVRRLSMFGG